MNRTAVVVRVAAVAVALVTLLPVDLRTQIAPAPRKTTMPLPRGPLVPGMVAPPAPTGLTVTGSQVAAKVSWNSLAGVAYYMVTRRQGDAPVKQEKVPTSTRQWIDGTLRPSTAYSFVVDAVYPDGRSASAEIAFTSPPAVNPTGLTAAQTGAGQVQLTWKPVADVSYYMVFGPGSSFGGVKVPVANSPTYIVTGAPAGPQVWNVASFYDAGAASTIVPPGFVGKNAMSTPGAEYPSVRLTVTAMGALQAAALEPARGTPSAAPTAARFQVVATGFRVIAATKDNPTDLDGKYDEVFAAFQAAPFDRQTQRPALTFDQASSAVLGDVNLQSSRVRAGTGSQNGGLKAGDIFPWVTDPSVRNGAPISLKTFPMLVWKGPLTAGQDAVLIFPTLWEWDEDGNAELLWRSNLNQYMTQTWSDASVRQALTATRLAIVTASSTPASVPLTVTGTRPIGMQGWGLPRRVIVLTREMLESAFAAAGGASLLKLEIPFLDAPDPQLAGSYVMYIEVERIP